ncbi:alpha/beta hydrolase [Neptunomonas sp.]|uniref:serine aminopeptidase domain-containing protein n=1 Tax=Neptunomonas sp. TaxID=1971898 RepID=UPI0025EC2F25|nr:alpha/beta hydrolase [Neptunomonas sp.]
MNIVLLPGLDGTGELFDGLLPYLSSEHVEIIPLPNTEDQSYEFLATYVINQLPKKDFVLIAESFSGPIAAILASKNIENLKGIIFVATFLSPPKKHFLSIFQYLPIKILSKLPLSSSVLRYFILGGNASRASVKNFLRIIDAVPESVLKHRMASIKNFSMKPGNMDTPAIYIRAESDKLVPMAKSSEFQRHFSNIAIKVVIGPHFILQASPSACANIITCRSNF